MRILLLAFLSFISLLMSAPATAALSQKVLIVVSSEGRDGGKTRPGFEYDEFAQAWSIFRANGFAVEVASPAGGAVEADEYEADKPYNAAALADPDARKWLSSTQSTKRLSAGDYAGIYLIGGGGAMFDLFADQPLERLLAETYEAGGVVGGVCHGPAVLAKVRLSNGRYLVEGRRITGFTNAEEASFGKRWASSYPLFLENALKANGADFEQGRVMLPFAVADGRIVTGQNPFSTALSAEAMVRAMGKEPVARDLYPDERSLLLVAKFLAGNAVEARAELAAAPERHDLPMIGIYGSIVAGSEKAGNAEVAQGLELMQLAAAHVSDPRLELSIAKAEHRLGRTSQARARIAKVLVKSPELEAAKRLLASLPE